jgi:hypothetical protein
MGPSKPCRAALPKPGGEAIVAAATTTSTGAAANRRRASAAVSTLWTRPDQVTSRPSPTSPSARPRAYVSWEARKSAGKRASKNAK